MTVSSGPPTAAPRRRSGALKVAMTLLGGVVVLMGLGLLATGGGLMWLDHTERDASGYLSTSTTTFSSTGHALVSMVDSGGGAGPTDWLPERAIGTVRIRAELADGASVFIGIAPRGAIEGYLNGVGYDEMTDLSFAPLRAADRHLAGGTAALPEASTFWVASVSGLGRQSLVWDVRPGHWAVVIMRTDAAAPVVAYVSLGAKAGWLTPLGSGLLAGGAVLLLAGSLLAWRGARPREVIEGTPPVTAEELPSADRAYPLRLDADLDEPLGRALWLVKWLLAVPHYVVLAFLWAAFVVLTVLAGFAVLVTGHYPRPIFRFNVGVLRWTWRVAFYSYFALGTDRYPPFRLGPDPNYPADLSLEYPERLSRGLVLVKWWLLALPHYVVVAILVGGVALVWSEVEGLVVVVGGGLVGLLAIVAGAVLLVSGRYPRPLFDVVVGLDRWVFRVLAYAALLRDEYPPFRLDTGGRDPSGGTPARGTDERAEGELPGAA